MEAPKNINDDLFIHSPNIYLLTTMPGHLTLAYKRRQIRPHLFQHRSHILLGDADKDLKKNKAG